MGKMLSKYAGECYLCDQPIYKGDTINYIPGQRVSHWTCPDQSTSYDNSLFTCAERAREAGLPERTQHGNRPMLVQCLCGHMERYDLWPRVNGNDPIPESDEYLTDEDKSDEAILRTRASWKCSRCVKEQKILTEKEVKKSEKAKATRRAKCKHSWEWISHEERKCVKCGEIEFMPDMD